jgi:Uma2 family endonuclease
MATVVSSPPATATAREDRLYRIRLDKYHQMAALGILTGRDRVVLLDGLLVTKMTRHPPHVTATRRTNKALEAILPEGWMVAKKDPITLPSGPAGADSEPEPDVTVVRGTINDYAGHHPGPADIALVVEVAERSLAEDRAGLVRYAWAGIPTAWIINLPERRVEVYSEPTGPDAAARYLEVEVYGPDQLIPVRLEGREVGRIEGKGLLP